MKQHSSRFVTLVNEVLPSIKEVNSSTVKSKIEKAEKFYLIDVREADEWQNGHLPTALYLGKGILERDIEKYILDENAEIILYCGGGYRSALAAESLQRMGYKNVFSLQGGFRGWMESGYPVID